jgi:DNA-damage-inducible protein J
MPVTNINIQTDSELQTKAQAVLDELGIDMSTAINVFLKQMVDEQAIPFETSQTKKIHARLGGWEGKIRMSSDFNAPMDEFKEYTE